MTTKYYVDANGAYLGGFVSLTRGDEVFQPAVPEGAIEVEAPPADGRMVWTGSAWTRPKFMLAEYAAGKRRALVNGAATINVGERSIPTWLDPESRGAVTGLVVASTLVEGLTAPWKGADGDFYTLTTAEITALALGMMGFVQAAFATEAAVIAAIDAETITTAAAVDAAAWPAGL